MISIVISNPAIRELKGNAKVSGKPYHMRFQTGHAFTIAPDGAIAEFPDKFEIMLEEGHPGYPRGKYQLSPSALQVSREGRLEVIPRLAPVKA